MTEEGRAASRVAGQEILPPDWGMKMLCLFGGKHYRQFYIFYNQQIYHQTMVDFNELLC